MDIYNSLQIIISGIICGLIIFQTAFVAPTVFKDLAEDNRAPFLRAIFPKLFRVLIILGLLVLIFSFLQTSNSLIGYVVGGVTLISGAICNSIIPATNQARDEKNDKKFSFLHTISVSLTIGTLLVNLLWIFI